MRWIKALAYVLKMDNLMMAIPFFEINLKDFVGPSWLIWGALCVYRDGGGRWRAGYLTIGATVTVP